MKNKKYKKILSNSELISIDRLHYFSTNHKQIYKDNTKLNFISDL